MATSTGAHPSPGWRRELEHRACGDRIGDRLRHALVLAGLGKLLAERSGVLNLGVEGMMLMGAVCAFFVSQKLHWSSAFVLGLAVLASMVAGALTALIHAFLTITIRVNQIVSGLAITIFAGIIGLSSYLGQVWNIGGVAGLHQFNQLDVLGLKNLPIAGPSCLTRTPSFMPPGPWSSPSSTTSTGRARGCTCVP